MQADATQHQSTGFLTDSNGHCAPVGEPEKEPLPLEFGRKEDNAAEDETANQSHCQLLQQLCSQVRDDFVESITPFPAPAQANSDRSGGD